MQRWVVNIIQAESRDAVTKPKSDITKIAQQLGYEKISIRMQDTRIMSDEILDALLNGVLSEIENGDVILYQFPTLLGVRFEETFMDKLKTIGAKVIVLMHDSEWLRGFFSNENIFLNNADVVIGHGAKMNDALREYGVQTKIICKELFDYLHTDTLPINSEIEKKVTIAGNLDKSIFIENWPMNMPELHAFGRKTKEIFGINVIYHGSFSSQDLLKNISGDSFGIAWDDNLPGGGDYQGYTRFNSPHKVSLYLSLGMPVIVWEEAAIAHFIDSHHLGFTISDPYEIKEKLDKMSDNQLQLFKSNARNMANILRNGGFTRDAVIKAESIIFGVDGQ